MGVRVLSLPPRHGCVVNQQTRYSVKVFPRGVVGAAPTTPTIFPGHLMAGLRVLSSLVVVQVHPWEPYRDVAQLGSALRQGRRGRTFKSCHPDHLETSALGDFGTTLVVVVVQELPLMESKPVKVLGRPAKTDVLSMGIRCKSYALLHFKRG